MRYNDELDWESGFENRKIVDILKRNFKGKNCQRLVMDWKWRSKIGNLDVLGNSSTING